MIIPWTVVLARCCCISMLLLSIAFKGNAATTTTTSSARIISPTASTTPSSININTPDTTEGALVSPTISPGAKAQGKVVSTDTHLTADDCGSGHPWWLPFQGSEVISVTRRQGQWRCIYDIHIALLDKHHLIQLNLSTFLTAADMRDFHTLKELQLKEKAADSDKSRHVHHPHHTSSSSTNSTKTNVNSTKNSYTDYIVTSKRADDNNAHNKPFDGENSQPQQHQSTNNGEFHPSQTQFPPSVNNNKKKNNSANSVGFIHNNNNKKKDLNDSDNSRNYGNALWPNQDNVDKSSVDLVGRQQVASRDQRVKTRSSKNSARRNTNNSGRQLSAQTHSLNCDNKLTIQDTYPGIHHQESSAKPLVVCLEATNRSRVYHYQANLTVTLTWNPKAVNFFALEYRMISSDVVPCNYRCSDRHLCLLDSQLCDGHDDCVDGSDERDCKFPGTRHPSLLADESSHMVIIAVSALGVIIVVLMLLLMIRFKCRSNIRQPRDSLLQQQQRTHSLSSEMYQSPTGSVQESGVQQYDQRAALLQEQRHNHPEQQLHLHSEGGDSLYPSHRQHSLPTPAFEEAAYAVQFSSLPERSLLNSQNTSSDCPSPLSPKENRSYHRSERDVNYSYPHHIARSRDGEEGYPESQRALHCDSLFGLQQQQLFRPPPNKTIFDRASPPPPYSRDPPGTKSLDSILPTKHRGLIPLRTTGQSYEPVNNKQKNEASPPQVLRCHSMSTPRPDSIQRRSVYSRSGPPPDYHQITAAISANMPLHTIGGPAGINTWTCCPGVANSLVDNSNIPRSAVANNSNTALHHSQMPFNVRLPSSNSGTTHSSPNAAHTTAITASHTMTQSISKAATGHHQLQPPSSSPHHHNLHPPFGAYSVPSACSDSSVFVCSNSSSSIFPCPSNRVMPSSTISSDTCVCESRELSQGEGDYHSCVHTSDRSASWPCSTYPFTPNITCSSYSPSMCVSASPLTFNSSPDATIPTPTPLTHSSRKESGSANLPKLGSSQDFLSCQDSRAFSPPGPSQQSLADQLTHNNTIYSSCSDNNSSNGASFCKCNNTVKNCGCSPPNVIHSHACPVVSCQGVGHPSSVAPVFTTNSVTPPSTNQAHRSPSFPTTTTSNNAPLQPQQHHHVHQHQQHHHVHQHQQYHPHHQQHQQSYQVACQHHYNQQHPYQHHPHHHITASSAQDCAAPFSKTSLSTPSPSHHPMSPSSPSSTSPSPSPSPSSPSHHSITASSIASSSDNNTADRGVVSSQQKLENTNNGNVFRTVMLHRPADKSLDSNGNTASSSVSVSGRGGNNNPQHPATTVTCLPSVPDVVNTNNLCDSLNDVSMSVNCGGDNSWSSDNNFCGDTNSNPCRSVTTASTTPATGVRIHRAGTTLGDKAKDH